MVLLDRVPVPPGVERQGLHGYSGVSLAAFHGALIARKEFSFFVSLPPGPPSSAEPRVCVIQCVV